MESKTRRGNLQPLEHPAHTATATATDPATTATDIAHIAATAAATATDLAHIAATAAATATPTSALSFKSVTDCLLDHSYFKQCDPQG